MIRNLNPIAFRGYGHVLPERAHTARKVEKKEKNLRKLSQGDAVIYLAKSDVWMDFGSGMSVLSVSLDGSNFLQFYLDKQICIKSGVYFALFPFLGDAEAYVVADVEPERVGTRETQSLTMDHRLHTVSIYTFFYHEKEQGFLFSGESHPMLELTYVDQGAMHSVVDGQDMLMKQGDLVLYGPNQWHMQYADIGVAPRFVTISFDIQGGDLTPLLNRKFTAPQHVVSLLQKMLREQERMDEYSQEIIIAYLDSLLLLLLRETTTPTGGRLQASNSIHSENEIIRQAQQFITTHIREKLSVPVVARQVDVSPSYLTALFHKNLQISPGEYIRRIKLQESKQMIRENNLNFTEIAAVLHYSTVHHFSRQFKEKFGITPTEYAKSVR